MKRELTADTWTLGFRITFIPSDIPGEVRFGKEGEPPYLTITLMPHGGWTGVGVACPGKYIVDASNPSADRFSNVLAQGYRVHLISGDLQLGDRPPLQPGQSSSWDAIGPCEAMVFKTEVGATFWIEGSAH